MIIDSFYRFSFGLLSNVAFKLIGCVANFNTEKMRLSDVLSDSSRLTICVFFSFVLQFGYRNLGLILFFFANQPLLPCKVSPNATLPPAKTAWQNPRNCLHRRYVRALCALVFKQLFQTNDAIRLIGYKLTLHLDLPISERLVIMLQIIKKQTFEDNNSNKKEID